MITAFTRGSKVKVFGFELGKDTGQFSERKRRGQLGFTGRRAEDATIKLQTYAIGIVASVAILFVINYLRGETST